jgi:hypothetical protein
MAITYAAIVAWPSTGYSMERLAFDRKFWETTKKRLITLYKNAILPKLALPRHPHGHLNCK